MVGISPPVAVGHSHDTVVYVPSTVTGPVKVTGDATLAAVARTSDRSRLVFVKPTGRPTCRPRCRRAAGAGRYAVTVGMGGADVATAIQRLADAPLSPISEPVARTVALHALAVAETSSNPQIKKNAVLAAALATLLLGMSDPNSTG
jgi:hypothetical protein